MNRGTYTDKQRQTLQGVMMGLMGELQKLAPHPDKPGYKGPLFIQNNSGIKAPGQHDGMLGSMILESMIGGAFAQAASEVASDTFGEAAGDFCGSFDATAAMEAYSEYISDIESHTQKAAAHGQGTLARLSGKSIAGAFNMRSQISKAMQAFYDDLPERMRIEKDLAYYGKQMDMLDTPMPEYAPLQAHAA